MTADATSATPLSADQLVRVAFFVRLISLAVALAGLIGERLTTEIYLAVLLLACVSYLGLAVPRARALLVAHPILAMTDLALVVWVVMLLGVESPLVLTTVSTALLIGVLYPLPFAVLPAFVLVVAHAGQAVLEDRAGVHVGFLLRLGMPAILAMLVFVGHAVRVIQAGERKALAQLAAERETAATERERSRLAREMHDGMAKSLQGLALTAAGLPTWVDRDTDRAKAEAQSLAAGAGRAVDEARTLLSRLRSDDPGSDLLDVVRRQAQAWQARTGRVVDLQLEPVPALDAGTRYELLAALGEALENVRQHAPGADVELRVRPVGAAVVVEVADDGPGFDLTTIPGREAAGHFGVRGMRERLDVVGGTAVVHSRPGEGTCVVLTVGDRQSAREAG